MTGRKSLSGIILAVFAMIVLYGCATGKDRQASNDYRKMVDIQQQKAAAVRAEEPDLPAGFEATAETHEKMGDAYLQQGDSVAAFTEYQKSLEKDPLRTSVHYKAGILYLAKGLPDDAIAEFDLVIAREPRNALAYHGRGRALFMQKKFYAAKSNLIEALKINDKLWQAHALMGMILESEKNHSEAQGEYLKALAINPDSAAVYNDLGVSYYLDGKYDKAADAFLKAFNINSGNHRICNNLGLALYRLGNTEDALEAFKKGGGDAAAYNNIGYLEMKDKQYSKALSALEKAVEANPSYYTRAQKNLERAKAALKKADNRETPTE